MTTTSTRKGWRGHRAVLLAAACAFVGLCPGGILASGELRSLDDRGPDVCENTNRQLLKACRFEARDGAQTGFAICLNLSDRQASESCMRAAREALGEAFAECLTIRHARDEVCEKLGDGPYDPVIDPGNFVSGIDNPYAPFRPGAFWEYEKQTAEGLERIRVEVLDERREILGVETTTLQDRVWLNGVLIEDTRDWVAQDVDGDVWYFGEIVQNFEDGLLANLDGSFEAGKDGAKAGFWVKAAPHVGDFFRQEWAVSNAEDMVEVLSLDAPDNVPFANGQPVLKTRNYTPLAPGDELKFYVPGVGFVLEVNPATGERLELVDYGPR